MTRSGIFKLAGLAIVVLLAIAAYRLLWTAVEPKIEHRIAEIGLTANEIAANGPLSGDVSLYLKELACAEKHPTPGYYQSINGAELTDSERSGLFACAMFTGSFDDPNQVYAWRSADGYQAASYINNRKPGELYISGGDMPPMKGPVPAGPFVAKADATTGKEIWRTYLDNGNVSGVWIANTNLNILPNGKIVTVWANQVVLLDGDTGLILKQNTVASSVVAVHQKDPAKLKTIFPFGPLKPGEWSFAPPKPQTDPENSMIYSADMGVGKGAGIKIDQATGEMKTVWVVDDTTNAFQPLIGLKDKRVLLLSNARKNVEKESIKLALFTANYKEQLTWHDAATGRIIVQSDFFEPLSPGSLITPGFGGRVYFPSGKGFIVFQVMPAAKP